MNPAVQCCVHNIKGLVNKIIATVTVFSLLYFACPALADGTAAADGAVDNLAAATTSAAAGYSASPSYKINNESISVDFRGVDIRDVLTALAIKMGVDIILVDTEPVEINFQADNITPLQAMELIIEGQGLTYLQNGPIMLVGTPGILQQNFFDQMLLTRFSLYHVPADTIKELVETLDLEQVSITLDTNQRLIWVQGTAQVLKKVRELIYAVDTEDSLLSLDYKILTLHQIPTDRAVELLKSIGIELKRYVQLDNRLLVFDSELFTRWEEIVALVNDFDGKAASEQKVFVYQLENITAGYAAQRLDLFYFGDEIETITYNYDKFGRELMVLCPPYLETTVRSALVSLDTTRQKTKIPVDKASGDGAYQSLNAKRSLLSELSGISLASFHISNNLSGDSQNPAYVLWVEETPDNVQLVKDLLEEMDIGSGDGGNENVNDE